MLKTARTTRRCNSSFTLASSVFAAGALLTGTTAHAIVIANESVRPQHEVFASNPGFASVGILRPQTARDDLASGTYLGNGWVLTAGHVADDAPSHTFEIGGAVYTSAEVVINDDFNADLAFGTDLALIRFDGLADANPTAAVITPDLDPFARVGSRVALAGFGQTGTGFTGRTGPNGVLNAGTNRLDAFGRDLAVEPGEPRPLDNLLLFDFDNPDAADADGSATLLEAAYGGGDSGSGVFVIGPGDDLLLIGIASFLLAPDEVPDASFGDFSGAANLAGQQAWISGVTGLDLGTPIPEPAALATLLGMAPLMLRRRVLR